MHESVPGTFCRIALGVGTHLFSFLLLFLGDMLLFAPSPLPPFPISRKRKAVRCGAVRCGALFSDTRLMDGFLMVGKTHSDGCGITDLGVGFDS